MDRAAFTKLEVYRMSEELANGIWDVAGRWGPFTRDTVGKQIVRSGDSIGANIAEGFGRGIAQDNCRFVKIARGSLNETIHHLRRAYRRGLLTEAEIDTRSPIARDLGPKLNAYHRSIAQRLPSKKHRTTNHPLQTTSTKV